MKEFLSDLDILDVYYEMLLIRRFEEKSSQLYGMGHIGGFCHLYIGQEAVVVGTIRALNKKDSIITAYRDHGHMLSCKMDPKGVMSELLGKKTGYSKGKGGSMHMFSKKKKFYGGHGIVGSNVSLGTGLAFAHKYNEDGGISATYMGDGAVNQGQVYESFNMASLWELPVLYIIENNQYAMGTSLKRAHANSDLFKRGESFNIPGKKIDGMDVITVYEETKKAVKKVRETQKPLILEMETYRYRGHSMSDPALYRDKAEVKYIKEESDPIDSIKTKMKNLNISDDKINNINDKVKKIMKEVTEFSLQSDFPEDKELYTDVYL